MVIKGQRAELNHVSKTSVQEFKRWKHILERGRRRFGHNDLSALIAIPGGDTMAPPDLAGRYTNPWYSPSIRNRFSPDFRTIRVRPLRTASMAALAKGFVLTNHWREGSALRLSYSDNNDPPHGGKSSTYQDPIALKIFDHLFSTSKRSLLDRACISFIRPASSITLICQPMLLRNSKY